MEQGNNFIMFEKRGFGGCWLGEIANEGSGRVAASSIGEEEAWLKGEVRCMTILSGARMQI